MVHASYCAPYPKWPCVKHKVNIWYPYCMMSFYSRTFYSFLSSSVINVVTTPSDVTDVTVWPITSNPNPRVLKIKKWKIKLKSIVLFSYNYILLICSIISSFYNLLHSFITYNCITVTITVSCDLWLICNTNSNVMLNSNSK